MPVSARQEGGITEDEFNAVLDEFEEVYQPIVTEAGGKLDVRRKWNDSTVNASAQRMGNTYVLNMFGGLARYHNMNKDGFMLVVCHEAGHHLGGAPKVSGWFNNWASNEGQADYYATLRCLRYIWDDEENRQWLENNEVDPIAKTKCEETFNTQEEEVLCMRTAAAGQAMAFFFQDVRKETTIPKFDTPDPKEVSKTDDAHPATQCRMDTYLTGSVCLHDIHQALSDEDPKVGTCNEGAETIGTRPHCWYKP
ncbi:MAG: hypothetical protein KDD22_03415 [Bdellovibrionales bacterium]|nr:hypothetical protein [Bdellovibrionales bacterium]